MIVASKCSHVLLPSSKWQLYTRAYTSSYHAWSFVVAWPFFCFKGSVPRTFECFRFPRVQRTFGHVFCFGFRCNVGRGCRLCWPAWPVVSLGGAWTPSWRFDFSWCCVVVHDRLAKIPPLSVEDVEAQAGCTTMVGKTSRRENARRQVEAPI